MQGGYIALVNAVNDFKPDSGYRLSTYLTLHIKNQCRKMTGRRTKKRDALNYAASLDEPLPNSDDMVLSDTVADPADDIEDETERIYRGELRAVVNSGVSALPEEYRAVITERFYNGCTYREIGEKSGYSRDKARNMETEGLRRLKANRELKAFCEDIYANAIRFTGLSWFENMQASSVELTAEKIEKLKAQNHRG